jgi:hypothetical protein
MECSVRPGLAAAAQEWLGPFHAGSGACACTFLTPASVEDFTVFGLASAAAQFAYNSGLDYFSDATGRRLAPGRVELELSASSTSQAAV